MIPQPVTEWPLLKGAMVSDPAALAAWSEAARMAGAVALIDKEEGWTSHDCVARLRTLLSTRKIGHAGTLDPLATGLLVVCIGKATKSVDDFQAETKTYAVVAKLGATTATDDRGSNEQITSDETHAPQTELLYSCLQTFVGEQVQIPPTFSAIRQGGRRQYDLAREGKAIIPKPRCVSIYNVTLDSYEWPFVSLTMSCSKGTYVRSLVRDLGEKLGVGAYVWTLRRTQSGMLSADEGVTMSQLNTAFSKVAA